MRRTVRDERGFTIVEVLVAAVILLVGIMGVVSVVNASNQTTTSNKAREQGLALARELLESARSVKYQAMRPTTVVATLQGMPGFANASLGPGWTIQRRGITYTVAVGVCSVDDAGDKTGAHAAGEFCEHPTVQASDADCRDIIGEPAKINGAGGSSSLAPDCGIDSNLDGQVDGLTETTASSCPAGTSVAAGTCDAQPDDFKRLVTLVTWDRGSGSRYVIEQATESFPGLSAYGAITTLTLRTSSGCCYSSTANGYTVSPPGGGSSAPDTLTFDATSSQAANQVDWLLGGVDQGATTWSDTSGSFTWDIGDADQTLDAPAQGEVVDGSYLIGARVQDAGGIHGKELDVAVTLNRRAPFSPRNFQIAAGATAAQIVGSWNAPPDQDLIGYTMYRRVATSTQPICTQITVRTCTDNNAPTGTPATYWAVALDRDPSGAVREGTSSDQATTGGATNTPPTVPSFTGYTVTAGGSKVKLTWTASTDSDGIGGYEVYRSGCSANTLVGSALGTATTLTDTQAVKNSTCIYTIRAKDTKGLWSALSFPGYSVPT